MRTTTTDLRAMGGLYEATASVREPTTPEELAALFQDAVAQRRRLTLIGARRSFGEHFLPPGDAEGVSTARLSGTTRLLSTEADGGIWVRAPGSLTFEALHREYPHHLPHHPPTGDRISLAGALAACAHNAVGFFAEEVRAFRLMTPDGAVHECHAAAPGLAGELFRLVPGSFGALGVILELELRLFRVRERQRAEITVLEHGPTQGYAALERLETLYRSGDYPLGRGLFFFGRRGKSVLLGDRIVVPEPHHKAAPLPLTDDATRRNIVAQGLANRVPGLVSPLQGLVLRQGRRFHAGLYGFTFFQRSYDRAYDYLASPEVLPRVLRALGIDPRLTVCHQTFAVPVERRQSFLDMYFDVFDAYPELEARLEQQDLIRLPECAWPLHAAHGMPGGAYLFSVSMSVRRGQSHEARARTFLGEVSRRAFEEQGVKVMLLKQAHCEPALLRRMHAPFIEALSALKQRVDPHRVLTSRMLDALGL
ncbi:FAD/FMN-containing dehydrogenase [Archangium gephyra]|uniref:FAD/FMN-containing dehydrogenase n=2 Tax=Archangium gephyra TaxID=48 RepID=A0ABX9K9H9_9BACT|nr:FAD-binding protein [Archangium gephyra]REG35938.1 FAD/FMN-containing dehydrogenase [Archangium gephyra]